MPTDAQHWSATDLRWVIETALDRGAHLLTAGEHTVVSDILALPDEVLGLFARLSARVSAFQRASTLEGFEDALVRAGLVCRFVPWSVRAERSTVAELKAGAARLGLPRGGKRAALVERLRPHIRWSDVRWVRVCHRGLIRRLEQFAFLRCHPDRSDLVVERLGHVCWPRYTPTPGSALFTTRRRYQAWLSTFAPASAEARVEHLRAGRTRAPGRLDRSRSLARAIFEEAQGVERSDPDRALRLFESLIVLSPRFATRAALRVAHLHDRAGRPLKGLEVLEQRRDGAAPSEALALRRTGRRLARAARRGWPPGRPLRPLTERSWRLGAADRSSVRPTFAGAVVEEAVIRRLAEAGRESVHSEGRVWQTLFGLLFEEAYFAPVPGQLPTRRLSGPLDLGSPLFAKRRERWIAGVLDDISHDRAAARIERAYAKRAGTRIRGVDWASADRHTNWAHAIGPQALLAVFRPVLAEGFRAFRGLPDLFILPGDRVRLPDALPSRLGSGALLAELKTRSDTLSDAQRVWLDRLAPHIRTEVWHVTEV